MLLNRYIIIGALVFLVLSNVATGLYFYKSGKSSAQVKQIISQVKQEQKTRKEYDKIDRGTPFNATKHESFDWLLQYSAP